MNGIRAPAVHSFHPNAAGQARLAEFVNAHLMRPSPVQSSTAFQGGTRTHKSVIAPGQGSATFHSEWPGSDVVMTLVSPSGRTIERSSTGEDVKHVVGTTFEAYTVLNPEPGEWTIRLYGADVAPAGEETTLRVSQLPPQNHPPRFVVDSPQILEGNAPGGYVGSLPLPEAVDPDDATASLILSNNASSPVPLGTTPVSWMATDPAGNVGAGRQEIIVRDTTPPTMTCPPDTAGLLGAAPNLGTPTVRDAADPAPVISNDAPTALAGGARL